MASYNIVDDAVNLSRFLDEISKRSHFALSSQPTKLSVVSPGSAHHPFASSVSYPGKHTDDSQNNAITGQSPECLSGHVAAALDGRQDSGNSPDEKHHYISSERPDHVFVNKILESPRLNGLRAPPTTPESTPFRGSNNNEDVPSIIHHTVGQLLGEKHSNVGLGESIYSRRSTHSPGHGNVGTPTSDNDYPRFYTTSRTLSPDERRVHEASFERVSLVIADSLGLIAPKRPASATAAVESEIHHTADTGNYGGGILEGSMRQGKLYGKGEDQVTMQGRGFPQQESDQSSPPHPRFIQHEQANKQGKAFAIESHSLGLNEDTSCSHENIPKTQPQIVTPASSFEGQSAQNSRAETSLPIEPSASASPAIDSFRQTATSRSAPTSEKHDKGDSDCSRQKEHTKRGTEKVGWLIDKTVKEIARKQVPSEDVYTENGSTGYEQKLSLGRYTRVPPHLRSLVAKGESQQVADLKSTEGPSPPTPDHEMKNTFTCQLNKSCDGKGGIQDYRSKTPTSITNIGDAAAALNTSSFIRLPGLDCEDAVTSNKDDLSQSQPQARSTNVSANILQTLGMENSKPSIYSRSIRSSHQVPSIRRSISPVATITSQSSVTTVVKITDDEFAPEATSQNSIGHTKKADKVQDDIPKTITPSSMQIKAVPSDDPWSVSSNAVPNPGATADDDHEDDLYLGASWGKPSEREKPS